ncbi:hypothetical protein ACJVC5_16670 [Peredibacter sp. HCB2-198]|uniref:hypothetical protein n=1 Tax=Peredibacter sp. HCB2-198 TaxID=3383025 RepID=UPI0038B5B709
MRTLVWILFWFFYFPLIRLVSLLLFWNSKVEDRERFEKRNKFESLAHSFREKGIVADMCFEFSSEGEYQQVAPLITDALAAGKKIELVFFSPSVEKAIMQLAGKYPSQIRYLRYPMVRLFPIARRSFSCWVTAKTLIMVRYDLLPELLLWSLKKDHTLKLVWMTFKKERSRGKSVSFWKKLFLKNASTIVYASSQDEEEGRKMGFPGIVYDFRVEQIRRRMDGRVEKFQSHFGLYPDFYTHINLIPREKRLIVGNAWPSDLFLLRDLPEDIFLVVVPHQLSDEILNLFREGLDNLGRPVFEINNQTQSYKNSQTILVNKKGILCELYSDFGRSYVGGGFEGSIHSVLEPLVAGSSKISCGPFHHRSTEYDVARDMEKMTEVNTPEQFLAWLNTHAQEGSHGMLDSMFKNYQKAREQVISC